MDARFGRQERERAAAAVRAPSPEAEDRLRRFVDESGFMVTTGQQPGLFTGPLFSIYKGLTAIALASRLERELDRPVIPVFWVASEDHDWAEASHTFLLDRDNELLRFEVPDPAGASNRPIHRIALGPELVATLDAFAGALPETEFRDGLLSGLRSAYSEGCTLAGGFRDVLENVLGPHGLYTTDAADPVVKSASVPLLLAALERAREHESALKDNARALEAAGYAAQVPVLPDAVDLFLEGPDGRERIYRDGDAAFRLRSSGQALTSEDIRAQIEDDPLVLSPNVMLRPVVESWVFPTLSYVGGPGEMAYFAQLGPLFALHGLEPPITYPRASVALIESKIAKVLDKLAIEAETLARPFHEIASEYARDEVPDDVREALGRVRRALGEESSALIEAAREIDPTLKGPIGAARNASFAAFNDAEKKILQSVKRESDIALAQLEKAQANLYPGGTPQERVLNVYQYLVLYGRDLLDPLGERVREFVRINTMEPTSAEAHGAP